MPRSFLFSSRVAAPTSLLFFGLTVLLIAAYRVAVFGLIRGSYPTLNLSFSDFLIAGARGDGAALLILGLFAHLLLVAVAPSVRAQRAVVIGLLSLEVVFLSLAVNFFDVYEAPFQRDFVEGALAPDIHGSFASFAAELSPSNFLRIAVALAIIVAVTQRAFRKRLSTAAASTGAELPRHRLFAWLPAGAAVLVLGLLAVSPSHAALVTELAVNPVYGLLASETTAAEPAPTAEAPRAAEPFSFRFDTASKVGKKHYPGLPGLAPGEKYNILFYFIESTASIYVDEERNGKPVAPVIHGLRKHGITFKNHYANYPLSANAMLGVLASAYDSPGKKPVVQEHSHIGLTTLPEALSAAGYRTYLTHSGMLGYANQDKFLEVRRLDRIEDMPKIKEPPYTEWVGWGLDDRAMIKPTLQFISEDRSRPFFAAMFPVCPHHPYAIPDKSFSLGEISSELPTHERVRMKYLDSLHYSDFVLGELVDALEKAGMMDDTLLFVFADHGEAFYQHEQNFNHPLFLYEENVHVPFLVYNKALFAEPQVYEGVTRHVDLMPTVLDLVGLPPQKLNEGISLASPHDEQLSVMHTSYKDDWTAVRDGPWKYLVRSPDGHEELYDLTKDVKEKHNVADANPTVATMYREYVARSREHREEYYKRVLRDFPEHLPPPGSRPSAAAGADADAGVSRAGSGAAVDALALRVAGDAGRSDAGQR